MSLVALLGIFSSISMYFLRYGLHACIQYSFLMLYTDDLTLLRLCKVDEKTRRYSVRSHVLKRCLHCNIYDVHICIPRHVR